MSEIIASCPKCHAQYKLTPEQLSIAAGKVRCGACMTVFQASPAAVRNSAASAGKETAAADISSKAPQKTRSTFVNDDDEKLLATLDEELFADDEPKKSADSFVFSHEFDQALKDNGLLNDDVPAIDEDDEAWARQLLEEEETGVEAIEQEEQRTSSFDEDPFAVDLEGLDISLELTQDEEQTLEALTAKEDLRGRIQSAPLELTYTRNHSLWVNLALGLMALIALVGLLAQLLFFQFDDLAKTTKWRAVYENVCAVTGCSLPPLYDVKDIKASQLLVKSHPRYAHSLLVDAILLNQADKPQPFPLLTLVFTNNQGEIVAARTFQPEQYLRGELAYKKMMPVQQAVPGVLELDDPGSVATGYYMQLSYAKTDE